MKGKKLLTGLLSAAMVIGSVAVPVFADDSNWIDSNNTDWYTGKESEKEYTLNTAEELAGLASLVNSGTNFKGKTVKLGNDIDLKGIEWTPIGKSGSNFQGIFDGNKNTIKNLLITTTSKDDVGLFGFTTNGEIKNFTLENAQVSGDLDVGAVAGTPYTSKYSDITVQGTIQINGTAYVGGAFGKNAYANLTNVDVIGDKDSYVKANSGSYRTYVGGLVGFMGEGNQTISNCDVAINVSGSTCDVGGVSGNLHYGNKMINCTYRGSLALTNPTDSTVMTEIGGLVGTYVTESGYVTSIEGCRADIESAMLTDLNSQITDIKDEISATGAAWKDKKSDGEHTVAATINGREEKFTNNVANIGDVKYFSLESAMQAANSNDTIDIVADITFDKVTGNYGKALINVTKADNFNLTINGNGHKISTGVVLSQIDADGAPYVPSISIKSNGGSLTVDNVVMPENLKFNIYGTEATPADSLTIQNCTMNGSILDYMEATKNITYDNNNFAVNKNQYKTKDNVYPVWYKMQNKAAVESFTFTNNKVDFPRGIQLSNLPENMKINVTGNTFDIHNENSEKNSALMIGAGQSADKQFKGKVVFSQNTVTAENGSALCIYSPSDNNTGFDFEAKSNIVAGGAKLVGYNIWSYNNTAEKEAAEALVNKVLKNVNGSEKYADTIDLKFVPTSDKRVYDIVLSGNNRDINRLNAAEFTFSLDTTDKITYEIAPAEKMSLIPDHKNNKYEFHFDGKDDGVADTATEIKIGTVAFDGFGTFAFSATAGKVTATTVADNLVTEFVTVAETGKGTLKISDVANEITETTISVPKHKLTINIAMNHKVTDNVKAYQNMTVEISGGNLGTNTKKYELGTDGNRLVNGVYTIKEKLDENGLYTVTVKGAGYRTARYTVALTGDKTMYLWNNVMTAPTIVVDDVEAKTNFLAGDIIKDGTINIYDLSAVVAYFNADKTLTTSEYNKLAKYDLNRDGKIDMMDISIVLTSWNN